jgi:hypothetical protein
LSGGIGYDDADIGSEAILVNHGDSLKNNLLLLPLLPDAPKRGKLDGGFFRYLWVSSPFSAPLGASRDDAGPI